ncbi:unnamed protein product [Didymodactylos carnosus]|uniref:Bromodomain adjacent to zinc finger domain protein 2B n=1 Tax=Didymodactylos carnosus TaxID=1234261 RepID=A0A813Y9M2_9BILA|nr:unnamed protein product [Didymodactylos carnosus]CAF0881066.1 unnamed protein product [Didymodactylos carnosus]CAF3539825.1 unnamed protein product [Didymodactylos carnosus]CAF3667232.1 unnamed protein product [Didymodactylos carnosus]
MQTSNENYLPWTLPLSFAPMSSMSSFPCLPSPFGGLPNFPLNTFPTGFSTPSLTPTSTSSSTTPLSTESTDVWQQVNDLSRNSNVDYNEYAKQLNYLMKLFTEQSQTQAPSLLTPQVLQESLTSSDKRESSKSVKHPNKRTEIPATEMNGKHHTSKTDDNRSTSTSSTSSSRKSSTKQRLPTTIDHKSVSVSPSLTTTSLSPSQRSSPSAMSLLPTVANVSKNPSSTASPATTLNTPGLDQLASFGTGFPFPFFLPSFLPTATGQTNSNTHTSTPPNPYASLPFSSLSSTLLNPTALYPFFSPEWFHSKLLDSYGNLTDNTNSSTSTIKSNDDNNKDVNHQQTTKSNQTTKVKKHNQHVPLDNKSIPALNSLMSETKPKKRAKSIRALTEEQELYDMNNKVSSKYPQINASAEKNPILNSHSDQRIRSNNNSTSTVNSPSLLHSALMKSSLLTNSFTHHDVVLSPSINSFSSSPSASLYDPIFALTLNQQFSSKKASNRSSSHSRCDQNKIRDLLQQRDNQQQHSLFHDLPREMHQRQQELDDENSKSYNSILFDDLYYNQQQQQQNNSWIFQPVRDSIDDSEPSNSNGRRSSGTLTPTQTKAISRTPVTPYADESRSADDDDSEANSRKRRKTEDVNEELVRIPLNRSWKRVTVVRAITRTGVRGDVCYYAPCGRKLRSFQEIDRYLSRKSISDLNRSHFTFSSKIHIGLFREPKLDQDGKTIFEDYNEDEIYDRILAINPKFHRMKCEYDEIKTNYSVESPPPSVSSSTKELPTNNITIEQHDIARQIFDSAKLRLEQEELAKRAVDIKNKRQIEREARRQMQLFKDVNQQKSTTSDSHNTNNNKLHHHQQLQQKDFLKALIEQQKLQQELEHQKQMQQEQQEQERKRQELFYMKQMELKKRQEEKLMLSEQRKAEKNAIREKKIQQKYMEIVLAKETKKVAEDMILKDLKPLPTLKAVENIRLSVDAFANCLMVIEFLNNFKQILNIPDKAIPTLNCLQQGLLTNIASAPTTRDINSLCQILLKLALDDPGIPNPKKGLTNLGQKLSEVEINDYTFSEILRLFMRERHGFDEKLAECLAQNSFHALNADEKAEILAFLCNELLSNKKVVDDIDHHLDELTTLRHDKWEIERRLRRMKFDKGSKRSDSKLTVPKDKDGSDNDSINDDDSDGESMRCDDENITPTTTTVTSILNNVDPLSQQSLAVPPSSPTYEDIESIDETKIDDIDKRITIVTKKHQIVKKRVIEKQCKIRALHLGQDRYRRRYWYFPQIGGVYVEGLMSGDKTPADVQLYVENITKRRLERKYSGHDIGQMANTPLSSSRTIQQRKSDLNKLPQDDVKTTAIPIITDTIEKKLVEKPTPVNERETEESSNETSDDDGEDDADNPEREETKLNGQTVTSTSGIDDDQKLLNDIPSNDNDTNSDELATMDLTAFCLAVKRESAAAVAAATELQQQQDIIIKPIVEDEIKTEGQQLEYEQNNEVNGEKGLISYGKYSNQASLINTIETATTIKNEPSSFDRITTDLLHLNKQKLTNLQQSVTDHVDAYVRNDQNNSSQLKKRLSNDSYDNNAPLDLSCSKPKRQCKNEYWINDNIKPMTLSSFDQFQELNGLATAALLFNNFKQEQPNTVMDLSNSNLHNILSSQMILNSFSPTSIPPTTPMKNDSYSSVNFKHIETMVRDQIQYPNPLPIPDEFRSGWWRIQTPEELRTLMKQLAKRGQRERLLCRALQRNFDSISTTMKSVKQGLDLESNDQHSTENTLDETSMTTVVDTEQQTDQIRLQQEMDVLNEIYNLCDRIVGASLQCRSYDMQSPRKRLTLNDILLKGYEPLQEAKHVLSEIERNIERRYLKHPFVRKHELNLTSLSRTNHINNNNSYSNDPPSKYDDAPQQLERWRRTINETRTPAQLALCLSQLERCIAWEKSIMKVICQICNSDVDEDKLLLCDGCDKGTHTYCFHPSLVNIPSGDWYCYVCIGKAKGEGLCFVCGNKNDGNLNRCEYCAKLFHEDCLQNAKHHRGKWLCIACGANECDRSKWKIGRQTSRSNIVTKTPNSKKLSPNTNNSTNGDVVPLKPVSSRGRGRGGGARGISKNRSSTYNNETVPVLDSLSNCSTDVALTSSNLNESSLSTIHSPNTNDQSHDIASVTNNDDDTNNTCKTRTPVKRQKLSKTSDTDIKTCKTILNELIKNESSWPFKSPVDNKQYPDYLDVIKQPMDFQTMKKKMKTNQYEKKDDFVMDVRLIFDNCELYNEDDSPVCQAAHLLRTYFETRWTKQFG